MGNSGPFRGELGEATEGSIRTCCIVRWPGNVKPNCTSYAMFSTMDFFPTFAHLIGAKLPTDRPIDGVDQTDVLFGQERDRAAATACCPSSARIWWRHGGSNGACISPNVQPTGIGPQRQPGMFSSSAPMAGYPKIYNIEMDPHEDLVVAALFGWTAGPMLGVVEKYKETLKKYPNPPASNLHEVLNRNRKPFMKSRCRHLAGLMLLAFALAARAEEGGVGHYAPGSFASFVDVLPGQPGPGRLQLLRLLQRQRQRQSPVPHRRTSGP